MESTPGPRKKDDSKAEPSGVQSEETSTKDIGAEGRKADRHIVPGDQTAETALATGGTDITDQKTLTHENRGEAGSLKETSNVDGRTDQSPDSKSADSATDSETTVTGSKQSVNDVYEATLTGSLSGNGEDRTQNFNRNHKMYTSTRIRRQVGGAKPTRTKTWHSTGHVKNGRLKEGGTHHSSDSKTADSATDSETTLTGNKHSVNDKAGSLRETSNVDGKTDSDSKSADSATATKTTVTGSKQSVNDEDSSPKDSKSADAATATETTVTGSNESVNGEHGTQESPVYFNARTKDEKNKFLREIYLDMLTRLHALESGLLDQLCEDEVLDCSSSTYSTLRDTEDRRQQVTLLWHFLEELTVEDFSSIVFPWLRENFPQCILTKYCSAEPVEIISECPMPCLRCLLMEKKEPKYLTYLLYGTGHLKDPRNFITARTRLQTLEAWEKLFNVCRLIDDSPSWEALMKSIKEWLHKTGFQVPQDLRRQLSLGVPCTCSISGGSTKESSAESNQAEWHLMAEIDSQYLGSDDPDFRGIGLDKRREVPGLGMFFNGEKVKIMLVGKTGSGKSTSGNTILGETKFSHSLSMSSETRLCQFERSREGALEVIDCPGLFDTDLSIDVACQIIYEALIAMHPGPDVFLYILKIGDKYTDEEYGTFLRLKKIFGSGITKFMIILFTRGDELDRTGMTIDEYIRTAPPLFKKVLGQCGHRFVVFNNTSASASPQQLLKLWATIQQIRTQGDEDEDPAWKSSTFTLSKTRKLRREIHRQLWEVAKDEFETKKAYMERRRKTEYVNELLRLVRRLLEQIGEPFSCRPSRGSYVKK